jgi:hypothetical protein
MKNLHKQLSEERLHKGIINSDEKILGLKCNN